MRLFTEDELRKECIDFFKWNAREVGAYINYLVGYSDTDGFDEQALDNFEGGTLEERYQMYVKSKNGQALV
jgi:hypothetical protein